MTFPNDSFILSLIYIYIHIYYYFIFLPPPSLSAKIAAGAVVCVESEIRGDVTIGDTFLFTLATFSVTLYQRSSLLSSH